MKACLQPVLDELGVDLPGHEGLRLVHQVMQAAEDSNDRATDQKTVALYIGDWDPSGLYMSEVDLPTRLARYGGKCS